MSQHPDSSDGINCRSALAPRTRSTSPNPRHRPTAFAASALLHRFCARRHFRVNPKSASADISKPDPNLYPPTFPKPDAKPVGAGLLANPVSQSKSMAQTRRPRGQARSYTGSAPAEISKSDPKSVLADIPKPDAKTCRSRLAGERGVSAQTHGTDTPPSRASAFLQWTFVELRKCSHSTRVSPLNTSSPRQRLHR
jgi:hypothetical protein